MIVDVSEVSDGDVLPAHSGVFQGLNHRFQGKVVEFLVGEAPKGVQSDPGHHYFTSRTKLCHVIDLRWNLCCYGPPLVDQLVVAPLLGRHCLYRQLYGHSDNEVRVLTFYYFGQNLGAIGQFDLTQHVRDRSGPAGRRDANYGVAVQDTLIAQVHLLNLERCAGLAEGGGAENRDATVAAPETDEGAFGTRIIGDS